MCNVFKITLLTITLLILPISPGLANSPGSLPMLDPNFAPTAKENRESLYHRLILRFDEFYKKRKYDPINKNLAKSIEFYYLRDEFVCLIDMWKATNDKKYLMAAKRLALKAINDATINKKPLLYGGQTVGVYPCFYDKDLKRTGGHGQLWDLQGGQGLSLTAVALRDAGIEGWQDIADFVEKNIIEKWLNYPVSIVDVNGYDIKNGTVVLRKIEGTRGKRGHFASICMDLHLLGRNKYPYDKWARVLCDIYLSQKSDRNANFNKYPELKGLIPTDWGTIVNEKTNGLIWYGNIKWPRNSPPISIIMDTSHANNTPWLACRAFDEGYIDKEHLNRFVNTLKKQIWRRDKPGFYFTNFVDGGDNAINKAAPGQRGSVWFGWHRLAAYDIELKDLFISIAYDLSNDGPNIADGTLNKVRDEAQLCFTAWGARLLKQYDDDNIKFP
jgi:hypothetical protein